MQVQSSPERGAQAARVLRRARGYPIAGSASMAGAPVAWHDCLLYAGASMLVITKANFSPLDSILVALAVIAPACMLLMRSRHD